MGNGFRWGRFKKIVLVGQSHLDAAWRWRTKQGIIKARATFSKAIKHINELPEFTFAQPSPCYYDWMKRYYPALYSQIKDAVKKGRWIPIGGMWVEADQNIPSGEALVRQRLYGQRFYLREFGFISDTEFLQDCFGFNRSLPQILKKSGARIFGTGKLFWNETNVFPFGMVMWESPDGSRIPSIFINFGYFLPITYGKKAPRIYLLQTKGKPFRADYRTPLSEIEQSKSDELMLDNIFGYGLGDGGHGPIEAEITVVRALKRLSPGTFKFFQWGDFYGLFKKYMNRWPIWADELYLELHRGTYTTHSIIKKMNRLGEISMETLEKMFSVACLHNLCPYPKDAIEKHWKIVLYNQFHDILPGSSIPEVYEDTLLEYGQVMDFYRNESKRILQACSVVLKSDGSKKTATLVAFNPLNWIRFDPLMFEIEKPYSCLLIGDRKKPVQIYEKRSKKYGIVVLDSDERCPALGFKKWALSNDSIEIRESSMVKKIDDAYILENSFVRVKISKSGLISSIYDKGLNIEGLKGESCEFRFYNEAACKNDAWNLYEDYKKYPMQYPRAPLIRISADGPHYAELSIEFTFQSSRIIERVGLFRSLNRVYFCIDMDWKEKEVLCKFTINTQFNSVEVSAESPYSFINRPIRRTQILDKPRFEVSCQRWISLFDADKHASITISNNCKYGFSVEGSELAMTLLRSPKCVGYAKETMFVNRAPDGGLDPSKAQYTDNHYHEDICFTLEIHQGTVFNGAWRSALELNYPMPTLISVEDPSFNNSTKYSIIEDLCFCKIDKPNVLLGAIKVHEDESDLDNPHSYVLRLIEIGGLELDVNISLNSNSWTACYETDLLELHDEGAQSLPISNKNIQIHIKPYEIKTFLLKR